MIYKQKKCGDLSQVHFKLLACGTQRQIPRLNFFKVRSITRIYFICSQNKMMIQRVFHSLFSLQNDRALSVKGH